MDTSGEWREERMYVLQTLEDVKLELRRVSEIAAVERGNLIDKGQRDINAAHVKIRALENSGSQLQIKNWIKTGLLTGGGVLLVELLKWYLHK